VPQDRQVVLETLRAELAFIESGGYRNPARAQWRPQFVFEDSPTCLNSDASKPRKPCSECVLAEFVPEGLDNKRIPCRYIPLNESGETIDSFYRTGTQEELEAAAIEWLKATIKRLETETAEATVKQERPEVPVRAKFLSTEESCSQQESVTLFSMCANPDCCTAFACGRGRFFRLHKSHAIGEKAPNTHSVQHFWLCEDCCREFTLEYQSGIGVLIKHRPDVACKAETARFIAAA
jgi:hypothetical protein